MNFNSTVVPFLVSLLCMILISCSSEQPMTTDSRPPAIYGRVLDAAGKPVANAGVSLHFNYVKGGSVTPDSGIILLPQPSTDILGARYYNPIPGHVRVLLLRADTRALVQTVIDTLQEASWYAIEVSTHFIPNQAYILRLETLQDTAEQLVIVNNPELPAVAPFVRTDSDGRFTIYYSSLPIGQSFQQIFETGVAGARLAIGDSLQLAIDGPEAAARIWSFKVDTTAVVDSTIKLP
jgi:hypothetical protein